MTLHSLVSLMFLLALIALAARITLKLTGVTP